MRQFKFTKKNGERSYTFSHKQFELLWNAVKDRYAKENPYKRDIIISSKPRCTEFVAYLRKYDYINQILPFKQEGNEGQAIYNVVKDYNENKPEINLSIQFSNALEAYATYNHLKTEYSRSTYNDYLSAFYTSKVLGEDELTLKDLYIEPKAFFGYDPTMGVEQVKSLLQYVNDWIDNHHMYKTKRDMLLILGYAGQGKTSFCYRLLFNLIEEQKKETPIFFYRLRDIEEGRLQQLTLWSPWSTLKDLIRNRSYKLENPKQILDFSDKEFQESILILDGLDELGDIHTNNKNDLCLHLFNSMKDATSPSKLILTSRFEIDTNQLERKGIQTAKLMELSIEEQAEWLKRYNKSVNSSRQYILTEEQLQKFNETDFTRPLVSQPILLHILSILKLKNIEGFNAAKVYNLLFDSLIERYWANYQFEEVEHPKINKYRDKQKIRELLQLIGFTMMKKNSSVLNHNSLIEIFEQYGSVNVFEAKEFKQLLLAFYFKENTERNELDKYALEFLHKTFGEYFAAEYVYQKIINYSSDSFDESIRLLIALFSHTLLPEKTIDFIIDLIENSKKEITINSALRNASMSVMHMPVDEAINIVYGFMNFDFRVSRQLSLEGLSGKNYVQKIRQFLNSEFIKPIHFHKVNLQGLKLEGMNWNNITLKNSNLKGINLKRSNLSNANLTQIELGNANLRGADFSDSNLSDANLSGSILSMTQFNNCNLSNVNFNSAKFGMTFLTNADLRYAKFHNATSLTVAQLSKAKTLYKSEGLPNEIEKELRTNYEFLFENPDIITNG